MRPAPSPVCVPWLRADEAIQVVAVASLPAHWISHWAPELNRAVKCRGVECEWCNRGIEQQLRVVVGVVQHGRNRLLFEFRERHRPVFDLMYDLGEGVVGRRLKVWKKGAAKNSAIQVELLPEDDGAAGGVSARKKGPRGGAGATSSVKVEVWDIDALVDALGVQVSPSPRQRSDLPGEARSGLPSVPADSSGERVRASV